MVISDKLNSNRVGILCYPEVMMSAVLGMQDMLTYASSLTATDLSVSQISEDSAQGDEFDVILLPPALDIFEPSQTGWIIEFLQAKSEQGAIIGSACAGVLWVAASKVDVGRRVTTHWRLAPQVADKWPELNLMSDQILIEHSNLITAGGLMSWIDLTLVVVERIAGQATAQDLARHFVVDPGRRDQRRYSRFLPNLTHGDTAILDAQLWLESNSGLGTTVASLANRAGMTPRTFLRRFERATGMAPKAYQQHIRVDQARDLLLQTNKTVAQVGYSVGYSDLTAFSRLFLRLAGQTPSAFRRNFRRVDG